MDKTTLRREIEQGETYVFAEKNLAHDKLNKVTSYVEKRRVLDSIDQLDEPETLSEKWLREHEQQVSPDEPTNAWWVDANDLKGLIVDEREKAVVPAFVGEWLEQRQSDFDTIYKAISYLSVYGHDDNSHVEYKVDEWLPGNEESFVMAWNHGYKLEEKKYLILNKSTNQILLYKKNGQVYPTLIDFESYTKQRNEVFALTEKEIKDYDERYWTFREEVER